MKPGNLLKLHGDIFGDDGDYICAASGLGVAIKYHCVGPHIDSVGEYLQVYYNGHLAFCLPSIVVKVIQ